MKKAIVASVLGIAGSLAMVSTSHAQGTVYFQNYTSAANATTLDAPVTFASNGTVAVGGTGTANQAVTAGWGVGSEFNAALLYSIGNTGTYTLLTQSNSGATFAGPAGYPAGFTFGNTADGTTGGRSGANPGYFLGAGITIPNYTTGSIAFIVEAYNGSTYAASVGAGLWRGESAALVLPSIATGTNPTGYLTGLSGFTVTSVPEPSTFAFAGMGLFSLLAMARRKKV